MRIDTLKQYIWVIKKLGEEVGMEITEEEIARKMNMSRDQFDSYLNAEGKTPDEVLGQLPIVYDDLFKAVQRLNRSSPFRSSIRFLKDRGNSRGIHITDEEINEKIGISQEQFEAYLNGEIDTPKEILPVFRSAWPDLYKNVQTISIVEEDTYEDIE